MVPNYKLARGSIPAIGLGLWQIKDETIFNNAIFSALEYGYKHFDTAQIYGNESMLGNAIINSGINRKNIFITTKISIANIGEKRTLSSFEKSLDNLRTDYVDLLLVHFPVTFFRKGEWKALEEIYKEGKARDIGVSNYTIRHLEEMKKYSNVKPAVNQVELHVFLQQPDLVNYCKDEGIVIEAYSPIAHGRRMNDETILDISRKYNKSYVQIMLKWCLQKGFVIIPKSTNPVRIKQNIDLFDFYISNEDMEKISKINLNMRTCWNPVNIP